MRQLVCALAVVVDKLPFLTTHCSQFGSPALI